MEGDQEQRTTSSMEESSAMTIEFLRARLLSERSVSKSARQRADDLAKRVAELEEQLKFVSLQRKKAEKATADVLSILENRGISDVSEDFDSSSEKDESSHSFKDDNGLTNLKPRDNEAEAYSCSEIESSTSTGRSLSWKSTKDSQRSLEKIKYLESVRRRATFVSPSSSARRVGKSCRRIRRRETRSINELQKDYTERATCALDVSNCSHDGTVGIRDGPGQDEGERTSLAMDSETRETNEHDFDRHDRDDDMESALQRQARLIGRYEEEEKAQREWEEKFRENNNGAQESYDPGNHSDVTEERYEMELHAAGKSNSDFQKMKQEDPQTRESSPLLTNIDKGNGMSEPSASEFSFPTSKESSDEQFSGKQHEPSRSISYSQVGITKPPYPAPGTSPSLELAVVPQESSNNLGSVLQALQQAKLSLNQKLRQPVAAEASGNTLEPSNTGTHKIDTFNVPIISPALFRLPTEATVAPRSIRSNLTSEIASGRFLTEPISEPKPAFHGSLFHTAPYGSFSPAITSAAPPQRSFSQPRLSEGPLSFNRTNHLDPYTSSARSLVDDTYSYLPDIALRLPLNDEGTSQWFPSSGSGLPPGMRLSSHDDRSRSYIYYR